MKYKILFSFLFLQTFLSAQKIKVIDSETALPVTNARIIADNKIYYTNDDGFALLADTEHSIDVNASGYFLEKTNFQPVIKLKPKYNAIDEVKIVNIDFQKILKTVSNNYDKAYYSKPIIYDVTVKQKSYENNELKLLAVANGKFWSRDGEYHAKDAFNNRFDNFVQLQIDAVRYLKKEPFHSNSKPKKPLTSHDNVGDMFLSYELWRTYRLSQIKNAKVFGRLMGENDDEQDVYYSIKSDSALVYTGNFTYNKKDKAISHFELHFTQSNSKPYSFKTEDGKEAKRQLGDGFLVFDYYKNGDQYYPSKISVSSKNFKLIYDDGTYEYSGSRDVIFKNYTKSEKNGLEKPVKINEYYWENMQPSEDKGEILLSKEEQQFINEKNNEK